MPMPRRPDGPTRTFYARIPCWLYDELHVLLVDPRSGRARYGTWSKSVERALTEWVDSQKVAPP
jgi:hypothetical protein